MSDTHKHTSKFLSLILRHQPQNIGLNLDEGGWADVATLLQQMTLHGYPLTMAALEEIVQSNAKQRFAFNDDRTKIRANQGHSLSVGLELQPLQPPEVLYHGTVDRFMQAIREGGLLKMTRHHVHLSADRETASMVGSRRGKPVVLAVQSGRMWQDGLPFYRSANGVWLADAVLAKYLVIDSL